MMAKPDSDMEGTICKNCERPINDHLPEELEECLRILDLKKLKESKANLDGVISGRAIYDKVFTINQAMNTLRS